jgi:hypothetical protein
VVRKAYAEFDYKRVIATLSQFMNTELSAFYFDIRKDTLYCDPPSSLTRRGNGRRSATCAASSPARWKIERAAKRIGSSLEASPLIYIADRRCWRS